MLALLNTETDAERSTKDTRSLSHKSADSGRVSRLSTESRKVPQTLGTSLKTALIVSAHVKRSCGILMEIEPEQTYVQPRNPIRAESHCMLCHCTHALGYRRRVKFVSQHAVHRSLSTALGIYYHTRTQVPGYLDRHYCKVRKLRNYLHRHYCRARGSRSRQHLRHLPDRL